MQWNYQIVDNRETRRKNKRKKKITKQLIKR